MVVSSYQRGVNDLRDPLMNLDVMGDGLLICWCWVGGGSGLLFNKGCGGGVCLAHSQNVM